MKPTTIGRAVVGIGVAAGVLTATALPGQASAQTDTTDRRTIASTLSAAERQQVDAEVTQTMRRTQGGVRVGLNQIAWPDKGAVMTIPLPGEKRARAADQPVGTRSKGCSYKHVCLYDYGDFEGKELEFYKCKFQKLRWYDFTNRTSSWVNNQTGNAKSTLSYWTGSKVASLESLWAPSYEEYLSGSKNNRADFVRVC